MRRASSSTSSSASLALEQVEDHPVRHPEPRDERFRLPPDEAVEGPAVPVHVAFVGGLLPDDALALHRIVPRLLLEAQVLDDVLGSLHRDEALVVEPPAPRAARDLLKFAHAQDGRLLAVVLAEAREEHRPDRDVHADAERVCPADDREQALLRELLDEKAVLGQEAGVVQADAVGQKALHLLAVRRIEAHPGELPQDDALPVLAHEVDAHQGLRRLGRRALGEVDDVHR